LFEESVLKNAKHAPKTSFEETLDTIRDTGFLPAQRDTFYQIIHEF